MASDLLSALVASPHFRWLPGLRLIGPDGGWRVYASGLSAEEDEIPECPPWLNPEHPLDLNDAATLGGLLQLAREAWRDPRATVYPISTATGDGWGLVLEDGRGVGPFALTEGEALAAAILAAPMEDHDD